MHMLHQSTTQHNGLIRTRRLAAASVRAIRSQLKWNAVTGDTFTEAEAFSQLHYNHLWTETCLYSEKHLAAEEAYIYI